MTGLITATFVNWGTDWHLPCLVHRSRDRPGSRNHRGILILYRINKKVPIEPHWTGKVCTVTQMIALGWIMLKFDHINLIFPTILATIFNIWSGYEYFMMGYRQLPGKSCS
jgi:hypothetical protein